jgi:hypothetical protein
VTLAFGFVTLTPSSLARATISILFLDETAWEILFHVSPPFYLVFIEFSFGVCVYVLCGEGLVVHKEEVDIAGVVNEESLVAGGHHVASLLV